MLQSSGGEPPSSPSFNLPSFNQETVWHILLGDYNALMAAMSRMAVLGYCVGEASPQGLKLAWSEPLPTERQGEFISDPQAHDSVMLPRTPVSRVIRVQNWTKLA